MDEQQRENAQASVRMQEDEDASGLEAWTAYLDTLIAAQPDPRRVSPERLTNAAILQNHEAYTDIMHTLAELWTMAYFDEKLRQLKE